MSDRTIPRLVSFALATLVTWSLAVGIDTLALSQHAAGQGMSQAAPAASQTAMAGRAPRS